MGEHLSDVFQFGLGQGQQALPHLDPGLTHDIATVLAQQVIDLSDGTCSGILDGNQSIRCLLFLDCHKHIFEMIHGGIFGTVKILSCRLFPPGAEDALEGNEEIPF